MTDKGKEKSLGVTRSIRAQGMPVLQAQGMLLGEHNINCACQ
jgi:hypothetical protein